MVLLVRVGPRRRKRPPVMGRRVTCSVGGCRCRGRSVHRGAGSPGEQASPAGLRGTCLFCTPVGAGQSSELTASDGAADDWFGAAVAASETTVLVGASAHTVSGHSGQGAAYLMSAGLVSPAGSTPSTHLWGGGSPSEACQGCPSSGASVSTTDPTGETVDPATGDVSTDTVTDLTLPGAGVPLSFSRTYDASTALPRCITGWRFPVRGYGWSDNLGMQVAYSATTQQASVTEENGSVITFAKNFTTSPYAWCPTAATNRWCRRAPGGGNIVGCDDGSVDVHPHYRHPIHLQLQYFRGLGRDRRPAGRHPHRSDLHAWHRPDRLPVGGHLPSLDQFGVGPRTCYRNRHDFGADHKVFDANTTLAATYAYTGGSCSTWSSSPADLCQVVDPGSLTYGYNYSSTLSTAYLEYYLTSLSQPNTSAATGNAYNSSGEISGVTDPDSNVTQYCYQGTN